MNNIYEDEELIESIGVLIMEIIKVDENISNKEQEKFIRIFISCYKISESEALDLFHTLSSKEQDIEYHIQKIKAKFKNDQLKKLSLMKNLNEMIFVDNIDDKEYEKFDKIKNSLF